MRRLEGKRILITGGSRGIGKAMVRGFVRHGAAVAFTYRTEERLALELVDEMNREGHAVSCFRLDCAESGSAQATFDSAVGLLGSIDVLVNNVGMTTRSAFVEITAEELGLVFSNNFFFPFALTQIFARHWLSTRNSAGCNKSVINISSLSSERAVSRIAHYQCSKAALSMLTKSAAYELADSGIRVNTISPGLTATEGNADQRDRNPELWVRRVSHIPLSRAATPEDHVGAAIFLASDESRWMTGSSITIDGGQSVA
ncbi:SDR family NAD(P)-dependent oxidoreductase [Burkholderia ubonensis]|uniref:SDR family NAD(P)-dependent oxidoreductase n=1 Tax=Burkholderia ubonensis TaxID=101571 RepID=UPI0007C6FDFB|nr:SDR family oxidoreductase [Burkholderia ubonensis]